MSYDYHTIIMIDINDINIEYLIHRFTINNMLRYHIEDSINAIIGRDKDYITLYHKPNHRVVVITGLTPCTRSVGGRLRVILSSLEM